MDRCAKLFDGARTKGAQSATQMYSYSQYLFMIPIVATVDFDGKDAYLVDDTSHVGRRAES